MLDAVDLAAPVRDLVLESSDGSRSPLPLARWLGHATSEEEEVLAAARPWALDIGCGPGRHVAALTARGVPALGVDCVAGAVQLARARGAGVLEQSIFDPLPVAAWGSALLLDGNIGIGGDPAALLRRVAELLLHCGSALVELAPPGIPVSAPCVRVHDGVRAGPWFAWGQVGVNGIPELAARTGFDVARTWSAGARWFSELVRR